MHCCLSLLQGVEGGGVEAEKILIYNSSSTITGRLSLKCLTIQYFSTKKNKKLQQQFLNDCRKLGNFFTFRLTFLTKDVLSLAVVSHVGY